MIDQQAQASSTRPSAGAEPELSQQGADSPWPRFFITRGDHIAVPLIPVDELPAEIRLQNAPRTMKLSQMAGMRHLGNWYSTGQTYHFERGVPEPSKPPAASAPVAPPAPPPAAPRGPRSGQPSIRAVRQPAPPPIKPTAGLVRATARPLSGEAQRSRSPERRTGGPSNSAPVGATQASEAKYRAPHRNKPKPPAPAPRLSKRYCDYWVRKHDCAYARLGECKFKHRLPPPILEAWQNAGILETPNWLWKEDEESRIRCAEFSGWPKGSMSIGPLPDLEKWLKNKATERLDSRWDTEADLASDNENSDSENASPRPSSRGAAVKSQHHEHRREIEEQLIDLDVPPTMPASETLEESPSGGPSSPTKSVSGKVHIAGSMSRTPSRQRAQSENRYEIPLVYPTSPLTLAYEIAQMQADARSRIAEESRVYAASAHTADRVPRRRSAVSTEHTQAALSQTDRSTQEGRAVARFEDKMSESRSQGIDGRRDSGLSRSTGVRRPCGLLQSRFAPR